MNLEDFSEIINTSLDKPATNPVQQPERKHNDDMIFAHKKDNHSVDIPKLSQWLSETYGLYSN